jgi:hypothetical protein
MATVNLDTAVRLDIVCRRNDTFKLEVNFGVEMPDSTVCRRNDTFKLEVNFGVEMPDSTANSYVFKYATSDSVAPEASPAFTVSSAEGNTGLVTVECAGGNMTMAPGLYVYDLAVTDTQGTRFDEGAIKTLLYGTFKVVDDLGA